MSDLLAGEGGAAGPADRGTGGPTTPPVASPPRDRLRYLPGLDGLRAVAVVAVLLYHLELGNGRATGGYLGVEVFFVVSGYLITGLLVREREQAGRIDLRNFWLRRARRLLPAAVSVIAVVVALAALFAPSDLATFRGDAVASLLYVQNWHAIVAEQPYFAAFGRPSPLRHLWSLSIEEQFYVVWPLLVVAGVRRLTRRSLVGLTLGGAFVSVVLMAVLTDVNDLERGYYGTDTRAFGLLIGAALALVYRPGRSFVDHRGRNSPWAIDVAALLALVALVQQLDHRSEYDPWTFPQGLLWVDALTVLLIIACATVGSRVAAALSWAPLVAIGRRSYSLYLWHWPIYVVTRPGTDIGLTGWPATVLRLALSFAAAEISYRYVEQPFRDGRAQAALRRVRAGRGPIPTWSAAASALIVGVCLVAAVVRVTPSGTTESAPPEDVAIPASVPSTTTEPTTTASTDPGEPATTTTAEPTTTVPPKVAEPVSAFGDSVMLGAQAGLEHRFTDVGIDAAVGRQGPQIVAQVAQVAREGRLQQTVVVHVGNNGPITTDDLDDLLDALGDRRLILVNVSVPRRWEGQVNEIIADFVDDHPGVDLVDWHSAAMSAPGLHTEDGVHLTGPGIALYAEIVAAAVLDG